MALLSVVSVTSEIVPTAVGARLGTVTAMVCWAVRLPSLAVTVTVAVPFATGVILTVPPDTLAVATPVLDDMAV